MLRFQQLVHPQQGFVIGRPRVQSGEGAGDAVAQLRRTGDKVLELTLQRLRFGPTRRRLAHLVGRVADIAKADD